VTSVLSRAVSPIPDLPGSVLRARLEVIRERLLELEDACPPELGLDVALDAIETILTGLGWSYPEPLSEHDLKVLAAAGAL
jgi:hypothetical protein